MLSRIGNRIRRKGLVNTISFSGKVVSCYTIGRLSEVRTNFRLCTKLKNRIEESGKPLSNIPDIQAIRSKTLSYIEEMRIKKSPYGRYRYSASVDTPALYASIFAVLTRHLYDDLNQLSESQRTEWIIYIQSFQDDDGLFRDPSVKNELADSLDGWGWRHLTLHAFMALSALGTMPVKPLKFLESFYDVHSLRNWLESMDWNNDVSNEIQNYTTALQYSRDFYKNPEVDKSVSFILDWLDSIQDPDTGLWGSSFGTPELLSKGVQVGYHLWLLYFYNRRPINYAKEIIDSVLKTQSEFGGFGVPLNSSACEDIDSIDPLVRLYQRTDYRRKDIKATLQKALPWVLSNMNEDGGFVFRREAPFTFFHKLLSSSRNESGIFPTWFRTLSLAYLGKVLRDFFVGKYGWKFVKCPGHQFWIN